MARRKQVKYRVPADFRQAMDEAINERFSAPKAIGINPLDIDPYVVQTADEENPLSVPEEVIKARLIVKDLLHFLPYLWREQIYNGMVNLPVMGPAVSNALKFLEGKE